MPDNAQEEVIQATFKSLAYFKSRGEMMKAADAAGRLPLEVRHAVADALAEEINREDVADMTSPETLATLKEKIDAIKTGSARDKRFAEAFINLMAFPLIAEKFITESKKEQQPLFIKIYTEKAAALPADHSALDYALILLDAIETTHATTRRQNLLKLRPSRPSLKNTAPGK